MQVIGSIAAVFLAAVFCAMAVMANWETKDGNKLMWDDMA